MINIKRIKDKHNFSVHLTDTNPFSKIHNFYPEPMVYNSRLDYSHSTPEDMKKHNSHEIVDKRLKGIMPVGDNYFHYFSDFVGPIIVFLENCNSNKINEVHLILTSDHELKVVQNFDSFLSHCISKFKNMKVTHEYFVFGNQKYLKINNSAVLIQRDIGESIGQIYNYAIDFAQCSLQKPHRNVFLSRRNDKIADKSVNRIANEKECEKFFESLGFEIAYVDNFSSLAEEIKYFNETKVLVGLSGAGMTNSMFMQDRQIVMEIVTPMKLGSSENKYELHNFYKTISALKDHKLISLSNINRSSDDLIEDIKVFKELFI